MGILVSAGRGSNILEDARTITVSPVEDALFPVEGLNDQRLGDLFKFGAAGAATITVDLGQATDGDMEGLPTTFENWSNASTGTGTAVGDVVPHTGSQCVAVKGGTSGVGIYRHTRQLRTGRRYRVEVWARKNTTSTARVRIFNAETRNYLQTSGGVWSSASADVAATPFATYELLSVSFTVEGFSECGLRDYTTIYFDLVCADNDEAYFDDFEYWPEVDLVGVFGHNVDVKMDPQVRSSDDNFSASDVLEATMTVEHPAFYKKLSSSITNRFCRVSFPSANAVGIIGIGELFLGQGLTLQESASATFGSAVVSIHHQEILTGSQSFSLSDELEVSVSIPLKPMSTVVYNEIRNEIVYRSKGSTYPIFIVYDDVDDPTVVIMGLLDGDAVFSRRPKEIRETSLVVRSLPYSTIVG